MRGLPDGECRGPNVAQSQGMRRQYRTTSASGRATCDLGEGMFESQLVGPLDVYGVAWPLECVEPGILRAEEERSQLQQETLAQKVMREASMWAQTRTWAKPFP